MLAKKIVSLIDEGYEIYFSGDDICRGLKIRVSKSLWRYEEFVAYEELCSYIGDSEFLIVRIIDKMAHKIDEAMKGKD